MGVATALGAGFASLTLLVASAWSPLHELDQGAADRLRAFATGHPGWIRPLVYWTHAFGPRTFGVAVMLAAAWLACRNAWRPAAWALAMMGTGCLLEPAVAHLVGRPRPPGPVVHASGESFPSGHTLIAVIGCAVLLAILPPARDLVWRAAAWTAAAVMAVGAGAARLVLGVHWVSDVLASWILGLAIVAATAAAFEPWRATARGTAAFRVPDGRPVTTQRR